MAGAVAMAKEERRLPLVDELKRAIADSAMSYTDIAVGAGVSQSQISRFMGGKTITVITAAKLFEFFGFQVSPSASTPDAPDTLPPVVSKRK